MTVAGQKLSAITPGTTNLASTDSFVVVRSGPIDALLSSSQVVAGLTTQQLIRQRLLVDTNLYVAPTGSDNNSGLSAGSPFLTIQKAIDTAQGYDCNSHYVTINLASGTYSEDVFITGFFGSPDLGLTLQGNNASPSSVVISSSGTCITAFGPTSGIAVRGVKLVCPAGSGLFANDNAIIDFASCEFGDCTGGYHMVGVNGGKVIWQSVGNNTISGGALAHVAAFVSAMGGSVVHTVTLTGTPNFSDAFVLCEGGEVDIENITFSGSATGMRYKIDSGGHVTPTFGSSLTYLPGNAAGVCDDSSSYGAFARTSSRNLGTVSSGTITALDAANTVVPLVRQWYYTNNGAHTFPAPTIDGPLDVFVTNGASAGTITFTGFTAAAAATAALTTTNTQQFWIQIMVINSVATLFVRALQ